MKGQYVPIKQEMNDNTESQVIIKQVNQRVVVKGQYIHIKQEVVDNTESLSQAIIKEEKREF